MRFSFMLRNWLARIDLTFSRNLTVTSWTFISELKKMSLSLLHFYSYCFYFSSFSVIQRFYFGVRRQPHFGRIRVIVWFGHFIQNFHVLNVQRFDLLAHRMMPLTPKLTNKCFEYNQDVFWLPKKVKPQELVWNTPYSVQDDTWLIGVLSWRKWIFDSRFKYI